MVLNVFKLEIGFYNIDKIENDAQKIFVQG